MKAKFYQVGGCVRDELLGLKPKDIDYSVEADSYEAMKQAVIERCGGDPLCIKVEKPEFVTIRAVHPDLGGLDFVLCRKDGTYSDGRRPDSVEAGTLLDDLARRDFTVNAMAKGDDGVIIDPFGGRADLEDMRLRCVGSVSKRFSEDSLRILRAMRFIITKGFDPVIAIDDAFDSMAHLLESVSVERIREELLKCFSHDTMATLEFLDSHKALRAVCFKGKALRLEPTLKK